MNDELLKLISRAQAGEKEAFGEIYKMFIDRIYRYIFYLIYDRELAEDLTQYTFLKAWKALPNFSTENGSLQAFLFKIGRNSVIDYFRKKKDLSIDKIRDPVSDLNIDDSIVLEEEKLNLYKALSYLDDFEKNIVILRFFEELSFLEIANITGKTEGAVRVRTHRALKKLKEIIKEK